MSACCNTAKASTSTINVPAEPTEEDASCPEKVDPTPIIYDLIIIGGGSAAFAAALKASSKSCRSVIINDGSEIDGGGLRLGGTCVNVGCVPSKAFIRAAEHVHQASHHPFAGLESSSRVTDFRAMSDQVQGLVDHLQKAKYVDVVRGDPNITVVTGRARLLQNHLVQVNHHNTIIIIHGKTILLATGASPRIPQDIPGLLDPTIRYLTTESLYQLKSRPSKLVVIGGGYIALENAQAFSRLGSQVTILQRSKHVLSHLTADLAEVLEDCFRHEGIQVFTQTKIIKVEKCATSSEIGVFYSCHGQEPTVIMASHILVATGNRGNTENMGLEYLGIETDPNGLVKVNQYLQTTVPDVYAVGDVIGHPSYVYMAAMEGQIACENALHLGTPKERRSNTNIPWVVFTEPQVAGVGLDEAVATKLGIDYEVAKLLLEHVPYFLAARKTIGFIKLLREKHTRRILGARILASQGSDMLMEVSMAIEHGLTSTDLIHLIHPYLTMGEGIKLCALVFDSDVSKLSCCAT